MTKRLEIVEAEHYDKLLEIVNRKFEEDSRWNLIQVEYSRGYLHAILKFEGDDG